ncbi:MAG: hypothetical protein OZ914_10810 [Anaerolineaceae bacterium]|jgi:hypothetical protein|nr:hypothetical protein [Anaerolineaceae bacterium]OQY87404.1 MAG: hypothetical protein B6D38_12630 [Anaerolineae bacterium UTCFX1]
MLSRHDFLKMIGAFGFVLMPLNKLLRKSTFGLQDKGGGELYEGFVLLDQDAPIPSFVQVAPCPILCNVDESTLLDPELDAYKGDISWFDSIENLRNNIDFRIFVLGSLPHKMTFLHGYVLRFAGSGEVWEARLDFGFENNREPLISLSARPIFARPYPVWPVLTYPKKEPPEIILDDEYIIRKPNKVVFTPEQGIMLPTDQGYTLQWIKRDVLYTIFMEYEGWRDNVESVGKSLVEK